MKYVRDKKGLTLVELLISMAILGIILVAFLSYFGFSFGNIVGAGGRTQAAHQAQSVVEAMYSKSFSGSSDIVTFLNAEGHNKVDNIANITVQSGSNPINYNISSQQTINGTPGYVVTVVAFYDRGKGNISLTAFIPIGGI